MTKHFEDIGGSIENSEPSELEKALARIELLEQRVKDLTFDVDKLRDEIDSVDLDAIDETAQELSKLQNTVSDIESDVDDLAEAMPEQWNKLTDELTALAAELAVDTGTANDVENHSDTLDNLDRSLNNLEGRFDGLDLGSDE